MPCTWKWWADRVPAGRLADRQTDKQTDKLKKMGDKYIWHSDSDIMPASCERAHARACMCVLKGVQQMEGLRKPLKYVWKEAIPVEACPPLLSSPLPYHLLFPLLSSLTFSMLHISLPYFSFRSHLFLLNPSYRPLWPWCLQRFKGMCAYAKYYCLSYNYGCSFRFPTVSFALCVCVCVCVCVLSGWIIVRTHVFFIALRYRSLLCVADCCVSAKIATVLLPHQASATSMCPRKRERQNKRERECKGSDW